MHLLVRARFEAELQRLAHEPADRLIDNRGEPKDLAAQVEASLNP